MSAISKDHQAVGLEISKLREQQGLSQIDLAVDTGLNKNTIGAMERGESDFMAQAWGLLFSRLFVPASRAYICADYGVDITCYYGLSE